MRRGSMLLALMLCAGCAFDATSSTSEDQVQDLQNDGAQALNDVPRTGTDVALDSRIETLPRSSVDPNKPTPDPWLIVKPTPDPWLEDDSDCPPSASAEQQTGESAGAAPVPQTAK
jgi:hypothetical protein